MTEAALFSDLKALELDEVERRYEDILEQVRHHEQERKAIYAQKKARSDVIKFAVNKLEEPPNLADLEGDDQLVEALRLKAEFDALLHTRDELVTRLAVPRHRLVQAMEEFHHRLTVATHYSESPSLANEMDMFSRFFEMQAMVKQYDEQRHVFADLERTRAALLETVKAINREDRKFTQHLNKNLETLRPLRREAGRLRAYLASLPGNNPKPLPEQIEEFTLRLAAGNSLSLEEFSAMLQHGGLTGLDEVELPAPKAKPRRKTTQRRAEPMRGRRRRDA